MIEILKNEKEITVRYLQEANEVDNGILHYFTGRWPQNEYGWFDRTFGSMPSTVKQIHGTDIRVLQDKDVQADFKKTQYDADGIITNINRLPIAVYTADCLPLLIYDPILKVIGAIHAGWRGSLAGIAENAVDKMTGIFDSNPADIKVIMGPSIQSCCFEVGDEVITALGNHSHGESCLLKKNDGSTYMDLKMFNRILLNKKGIQTINEIDMCTYCNSGLFDSYRRDGSASNRMLNVIMLNLF